MIIRFAWLIAGLASISFIAGCAIQRDDLLESFSKANPDATEEQAACVVDELINVYGIEGVEEQLLLDPVDPKFEELQFRTMIHCGMTDRLVEPLAAQLERLDVPDENRDCVVEELTAGITDADLDVLLSGELTDAYYSKFFDALTTCDALP